MKLILLGGTGTKHVDIQHITRQVTTDSHELSIRKICSQDIFSDYDILHFTFSFIHFTKANFTGSSTCTAVAMIFTVDRNLICWSKVKTFQFSPVVPDVKIVIM